MPTSPAVVPLVLCKTFELATVVPVENSGRKFAVPVPESDPGGLEFLVGPAIPSDLVDLRLPLHPPGLLGQLHHLRHRHRPGLADPQLRPALLALRALVVLEDLEFLPRRLRRWFELCHREIQTRQWRNG